MLATGPESAEEIAARLRAYLTAEPNVRVIEGQEVLLALDGEHGGFSVTCENGKVVVHFWAPGHSLVRRVVGARATKHGLRLQALRFGHREAAPLWIESGASARAAGSREYRGRVLAAIEREWAGWRPAPPVDAGGERRGASPFEFFLFRRRHGLAAAVAVAPGRTQAVADSALAALAIWSDPLAARLGAAGVARWMIVLPARHSGATLGRLPWLRMKDRITAYELDEAAGHLHPLSPLSDGNWNSAVRRAPPGGGAELPPAATELWAQVRQLCPRATVALTTAGIAFRLHGLTFARQARGAEAAMAAFTFGLGAATEIPGWAGDWATRPLTPERMDQFRALLQRLNQERQATAEAAGFLRQCQPEAWMEEQIRADLSTLDATLDPRYVYPQVPAFRRGQREVMDLLAAGKDGRLRVVELKASEDAQFPFQALDYWRAVRRHQERGDFSRLGYFPGLTLRSEPPRLTLVAPALRWHPQTEVLLSWLSPEIAVNRLGLEEGWRECLRVVERYTAGSSGNGGVFGDDAQAPTAAGP